MSEGMWREVISEALSKAVAGQGGPVPGARLHQLIGRIAEERGLSFPPDPKQKFHEFLLQYPDVVQAVRRRGQDLLAVPANRPELLSERAGTLVIRHDLYNALTRVNDRSRAFYDKANDRVFWLDAVAEPGPGMTPFPQPTLESEVALRREFVAQVQDADVRGKMEAALTTPRPFGAFESAVHAASLQRHWYAYRAKRLLQRLQEWASASGIAWPESWLVSDTPRFSPAEVARRVTRFRSRHGAALAEAISSLDETDLARISVPLDIVAKLLSRGDKER